MTNPQPRACMTIDDFEVGLSFTKPYTITEEMVIKFSEVCDDWNPLHHDAAYARTTVFRRPIAHGMLSVSQFSGIFGMDMPGLGAIWLHQGANFLAPVYIGEPHTAVATVSHIDAETNTVTFTTECFDIDGKKVMTGEGKLKPVPAKVKARMERKKA